MTPSLLLLCGAAAALLAFTASAVTALALRTWRAPLARRSPAAQSRVLLTAAIAPALAMLAVMTAALAPSFGWIADHCHASLDPHQHPHICAHHESALPALPFIVLSGFLALRFIVACVRGSAVGIAAWRAVRLLSSQVIEERDDGVRVLPMLQPRAFVLGVLRPQVFITRGLLACAPLHLRAALAHERAHLRRADGLRRMVAALGLVFHLPGVARALDQQLAQLHELAADDEAATELGSRTAVADALVHLSRAHSSLPSAALAFGHSDVEARVVALLQAPSALDAPRPKHLLLGALAALVAVGLAAGPIHHGVEMMLGLFPG